MVINATKNRPMVAWTKGVFGIITIYLSISLILLGTLLSVEARHHSTDDSTEDEEIFKRASRTVKFDLTSFKDKSAHRESRIDGGSSRIPNTDFDSPEARLLWVVQAAICAKNALKIRLKLMNKSQFPEFCCKRAFWQYLCNGSTPGRPQPPGPPSEPMPPEPPGGSIPRPPVQPPPPEPPSGPIPRPPVQPPPAEPPGGPIPRPPRPPINVPDPGDQPGRSPNIEPFLAENHKSSDIKDDY